MRFSIKAVGLIGVLALSLAGCNSAPQQGGLRTGLIDANDQLESKDVVVTGAPVAGAPSVQVNETLHYINRPAFSHNTQYQINRALSAIWVERVGFFVLHDNEGDWYSVHGGSTAVSKLATKPQASIGSRPSKLDSNDQGSVASVAAGPFDGANPTLSVTYSYSHSEALDDLSYTVTGNVGTTFVQDQNAWFAFVGGSLYRVDRAGQVTRLNDKPSVDRGEQSGMLDRNDSTAPYPDVTFDGGFFEARWQHVHEQDFEHVRYTTRREVRADYVREVNAYMAWIDGTEYSAQPPSNFAQRLNQRPIVNLGARSSNIGYDKAVRVDVFSVNNKDVVVRYSFHRNETYIAKEYYVDRPGVLYYNQNWKVWMVAIDGNSYVVEWDSDNFNDPSATILHAPAGSTRPQYSVPSTSGDGLPPAVVPGRDNGNQTAPPAGGIPGRAPAANSPVVNPQGGIPGRTPAPPAKNCIPGRPCN